MEDKVLTVALAQARIGFGVVSLLAPGVVARAMTGSDEGGMKLFVRMIGARDLALGLGLQAALTRETPTRGWLETGAVVDGIDAVASVLGRQHLRAGVFPGVLGAATGGALLSAYLARGSADG